MDSMNPSRDTDDDKITTVSQRTSVEDANELLQAISDARSQLASTAADKSSSAKNAVVTGVNTENKAKLVDVEASSANRMDGGSNIPTGEYKNIIKSELVGDENVAADVLAEEQATSRTRATEPGVVAIRGADYRSSQQSIINDGVSAEIVEPKLETDVTVAASLVDETVEAQREEEVMRLREQLEEERRKNQAVVYAESVRRASSVVSSVRNPSATPSTSSILTKRRVLWCCSIALVVVLGVTLGVVLGTGTSSSSGGGAIYGCLDEDEQLVPDCTCHESCASCGYFSEPVRDADCIACADGSAVKQQYLDETGLCNREISEDVPCLHEDYLLQVCLEENESLLDEACRSCRLIQYWLNEIALTCRQLHQAECVIDECCPDRPCNDQGEAFVACYVKEGLLDRQCLSAECN